MKKFLSAVTSVVMAASVGVGSMAFAPITMSNAADSTYEFENGKIYDNGTEYVTQVVSNSNASNGKVVDLRDGINYTTNAAGDSVTLNVSVAEAGVYNLTVRYSQNYAEGGKIQNVVVNGTTIGQITCAYTQKDEFKTVSITANLKAGENAVGIEASWGWALLDNLTVSKSDSTSTVSTSSAQLSNPKATAATQSLYRFLCDTYGKNVLSGQQESTWNGSPDYEMNIIKNASGKLPVIRGLDYMGDDFSGVNGRAKQWYAKGGIVTICWHCGSSFSGSWSDAMNDNLDWNKALTEGTTEYNNLIAGMDKGAKALKELQDAGVPVIWRPFHEFNGKWFWWGKGGDENFKKLWKIMYDRYTNYWGLNNLIWNLGFSSQNLSSSWYPGDQYVDVMGSDTYVDNNGSLADLYRNTVNLSSKKMPICLHENGPIPDPDKLQSDNSRWLWFMTWHTDFISNNSVNTSSYVNSVYNSSYVLTLDELPDVYNYGTSSPTTTTATTATVPKVTTSTTTTSGTSDNNTKAAGFYVDGTTIRDANGNAFVMRGVNIANAWYADKTATSIKAIAGLGSNCVRIVCGDGAKWTKTTADELKSIINMCKDNKQICILEVHDATGSDSTSDIDAAASYWVEMKDILNENSKYVIVNVANEWYGTWDGATWANGYKNAIKTMRDAGIKNMIMVDSAGWGQYPDSIKNYGKEVFDADKDKNTVFSIHMYEYAGKDASTIKSNIDNVMNLGIPVVIGEFGYKHINGDVDEATIMSYCNEKKAGYLGWSWKGNGGGVEYLDLSNDWEGTSLSDWGKTLFEGSNGIKNTSIICSVYSSEPQVTTATTKATTTTTTTKTTTTTTAAQTVFYGDANCDGKIDVSDVVAIRRYLTNSAKFALSAQGKVNADVQGKDGVNAQDAVGVQTYVLGLITALPIN